MDRLWRADNNFNVWMNIHYTAPQVAVTIHWTGLLDWNTGLDYWTEVVSFFGQGSMILVYFQIFDT